MTQTNYYQSESWKAYYKSDDWYCYLFELVDDYANTPEADVSEGIIKAIAKHLQADERKVWEILTAMECNEELTTAWACKELAQLVQ